MDFLNFFKSSSGVIPAILFLPARCCPAAPLDVGYFFSRRWWQKGHSLSLLTVPQTGQALGDSPSLRWAILQAPFIWAKFFCLREFGALSGMAFRFLVDGFKRGANEMCQT